VNNLSFYQKHKFKIWRNFSYIFFLLIFIFFPLFHVVKLDIAHGVSYLFGQEMPATNAFRWLILIIGGISILIIFTNLILGRVFCGWICPGGFFAQIQEFFRKKSLNPKTKKFSKIKYYLITGLVTTIFTFLIFNWITDLRAFFYITNPAFKPLWIAFAISFIIFYFEMFVADKWCRVYCPTGIYHKITPYFHFVKPVLVNKQECSDCKECIKACPMGLDPRKMAYINDFDRGIQACIECGECVDACVQSQIPKGKEPVLKFVKDIHNL